MPRPNVLEIGGHVPHVAQDAQPGDRTIRFVEPGSASGGIPTAPELVRAMVDSIPVMFVGAAVCGLLRLLDS